MLDKGKDLDWFESETIIILTIVSIIALVYFGIWTYFQKYPIVDLSVFKNRNFTFGTIALTVGYLVYFGSTVTLPLWLQTEQLYTAYWAGIAVAPIGIVPFFLSPIVGKNLHRFNLRALAALSFFIFAVGLFYQATFTTQVDLKTVMYVRFLQGFGVAIFFLPLVQLSLGEIPDEKYASASGLFHFVRILVGSGFGTSLSIELWSYMEIYHHSRLSETLTVYKQSVMQLYDYFANYNPFFTPAVVNRILERQIEQQAYMLSTNDVSWIGAWLFIFIIPLVFFCKPVKVKSHVMSGE